MSLLRFIIYLQYVKSYMLLKCCTTVPIRQECLVSYVVIGQFSNTARSRISGQGKATQQLISRDMRILSKYQLYAQASTQVIRKQ